MNDSINGLHWVSVIAYCGTNCLAVTQANHCSEFRIPNCPITDDHKATVIELRIYSRELMVMFTLYRGGSKIFFRRGALVSCSTSTPINHIVFFLQNTSCIRKPAGHLGGEGGGGLRTPCTLPLDPPLLYYSFNLHRPEMYIPARLGLLFTLTARFLLLIEADL